MKSSMWLYHISINYFKRIFHFYKSAAYFSLPIYTTHSHFTVPPTTPRALFSAPSPSTTIATMCSKSYATCDESTANPNARDGGNSDATARTFANEQTKQKTRSVGEWKKCICMSVTYATLIERGHFLPQSIAVQLALRMEHPKYVSNDAGCVSVTIWAMAEHLSFSFSFQPFFRSSLHSMCASRSNCHKFNMNIYVYVCTFFKRIRLKRHLRIAVRFETHQFAGIRRTVHLARFQSAFESKTIPRRFCICTRFPPFIAFDGIAASRFYACEMSECLFFVDISCIPIISIEWFDLSLSLPLSFYSHFSTAPFWLTVQTKTTKLDDINRWQKGASGG